MERIDVVPRRGGSVTYVPCSERRREACSESTISQFARDLVRLPVTWRGTPHTEGIDTVHKGIAEADKECPTLRMIIAGEGHEQPTLERLVEELNLKDNVEFSSGARVHEPSACRRLDFILLGSTREGFRTFDRGSHGLRCRPRCALRAPGQQVRIEIRAS